MEPLLLILYPESNFKAIGKLLLEIFHLNDLGDTESVVTNAVWVLI